MVENLGALVEFCLSRPRKDPVPPKGKTIRLPENDDLSEFAEENVPDLLSVKGKTFWMCYENVRGEESERVVRVKSVRKGSNGILIGGHCFQRDSFRTFRADRIEEMYWMDTGEVVDNPTLLFERLCEPGDISLLIEECWPGLIVMAHTARCDGSFHPEEAEIMADYVEGQCLDASLSKKLLEKRVEILEHVRPLYPDEKDIKKAIGKLWTMPAAEIRTVNRHIKLICEADGVLHEAEVAWVMEFADRLDRRG